MQPETDLSLVEIVVHRTFRWYPSTLDRVFRCYQNCVTPDIEHPFLSEPEADETQPLNILESNYLDLLEYVCSQSASDKEHVDLDRIRFGVLSAHATFAQMDCRVSRHEDWISGALESRLAGAFTESAGFPGGVSVWSAGLLGNREAETGADFAIFVGLGGRFILLVLQAKRTFRNARNPREKVDVSRPKTGSKDGIAVDPDPFWQVNRLQGLRMSYGSHGLFAGYIFYDNGYSVNNEPVLPLVMDVADVVKYTNQQMDVDLTQTAVDLSTIVMERLCQGPTAGTDDVPAMVEAVAGANPKSVLVIADDESLVLELSKYFRQKKMISAFCNLTSPPSRQLGSICLSDGTSLSFEADAPVEDYNGDDPFGLG